MPSYKNYQSKSKKHEKDRCDIYESSFESPVKFKDDSNAIKRNLTKWAEFCSYLRLYPDIYYDMLTPKEGARIYLHLYQRVMMRLLSRFIQNYFCMPRSSSKTLAEIMVLYHTAICFPGIKLTLTASTKESAIKIWKDKHDEILKYYPSIVNEMKSVNFSKDTGRVEFQNGSVVDGLANSAASKGLRRHRGSLEESALIDKEMYEDALEPIFDTTRPTAGGKEDPGELFKAISRFSTSGKFIAPIYRNIYRKFGELVHARCIISV